MSESAHQPNRRLPRAASVLRSQVLAQFPDAETGDEGEPDGFGVVRSISFGGDAAKMLTKALPHIEDERIKSVEKASSGRVVVTFVGSTLADGVAKFPIEDAALVAGIESDSKTESEAGKPDGDGDPKSKGSPKRSEPEDN